ncbi:MAG: hypothetical protein M1155_01290 [Patescibacteria group bacterium]|nr:hypothetical protein [Patescibacteria group bacterium]
MSEPLSNQIVEEIEKQKLTPKPRLHFLLKRSVLWFLAILASAIGAVAFSIIIFIFFDHDAEAAKYLHQSLIQEIMLSIPYIWILVFAAFIWVTKYSVHHTKTGYRYTTAKIIGIVLIINISLGLVLNAFDLGTKINDFLSDTIPYYDSLIYTSKTAWSDPENGLLGGYVLSANNSTEFSLRDFKNKIWRIIIDPNETDDIGKNIATDQEIKIIGVKENDTTFQAKQIFLWGD